ncbi:MAG: hypothetical protein KDK24_02860 [Pseudooceanicola sp.]|nr:hypothetical protein [Pseudooceanicola sp.]
MADRNDVHKQPPFTPLPLIAAMIGGPLAVTALTFWLQIPAFALVMGGPFYLVAGLPAAWWHFRKPRATAAMLPALAFAVNAALCVPAVVLFAVIGRQDLQQMASIYLFFGSIFAPVWATGTALIYRALVPARTGREVTP